MCFKRIIYYIFEFELDKKINTLLFAVELVLETGETA